ncbi:MAG: FeoB-associated Cys-rich membrane protein [Clostridia bacterium]|nr:FeoB-associated Cys-rich membrane protein [Clostridia bacterium]
MKDIIIIAVVLLIVSLSALYVYREKKKGRKCIGCPYSGTCSGGCNGNVSDKEI